MTQKVDIRALANLAKLQVSDAEVAKLESELPAILSFVETIQQVSSDMKEESPEHRNIMREDGEPHETGVHTEVLLAVAPGRRDNQVVVKQVISRKK
jgi:aspartyl/glutamyl-tRNA(Asn/Gln) amidotransferase C subunit